MFDCRYLNVFDIFWSSMSVFELFELCFFDRGLETPANNSSKFLCYFSPFRDCSSKKESRSPSRSSSEFSLPSCSSRSIRRSFNVSSPSPSQLPGTLISPSPVCHVLSSTAHVPDVLGTGVSAVFSFLLVDGSGSALVGLFRLLWINSSDFAICNSKDSLALPTFPLSVEFPCWEPRAASCTGASSPDVSYPNFVNKMLQKFAKHVNLLRRRKANRSGGFLLWTLRCKTFPSANQIAWNVFKYGELEL